MFIEYLYFNSMIVRYWSISDQMFIIKYFNSMVIRNWTISDQTFVTE